ncbi:MAG TPA: acyl carrier protein [Candidatus Omnitrophota bacterium]|nr:acyl carrier protein [Candidatus Omnitrophota bacterium]
MEKTKDINVENDIRELVAEILEMEPEQITPEAHFVKDLGMDSMMALEILASVEKKYKIMIPEEALPKFVNLKTTANIVEDILKKK